MAAVIPRLPPNTGCPDSTVPAGGFHIPRLPTRTAPRMARTHCADTVLGPRLPKDLATGRSDHRQKSAVRSEERRVGKERGGTAPPDGAGRQGAIEDKEEWQDRARD